MDIGTAQEAVEEEKVVVDDAVVVNDDGISMFEFKIN